MARVFFVGQPERLPSPWKRALRLPWSTHRLVGSSDDPTGAEGEIGRLQPDIVLLDAASLDGQALVACRTLSTCGGAVEPPPVIAVADGLDEAERSAFLRAGASGYLLNSIKPDSLAIALRSFVELRATGDDEIDSGPIVRPPADADLDHEDWMKITRRDAVTWLAVGTAVAAAPAAMLVKPAIALAEEEAERAPAKPVPLPASESGESFMLRMQRELQVAMKKPLDQRRWVMVIDTRKCVGCHACTIACKAENHLPPGVVYRPVLEEDTGTYPDMQRRFIARPCMQCDKPPCVPVCPVGATWKEKDGITVIDYDQCIGCRYCIVACPYSARTSDFGEYYTDGTPERQPYEEGPTPEYNGNFDRADGSGVGNARKCQFCIHRLNAGQLPACVTTCIGYATYFGDANNKDSLVSELMKSTNAVRLKEELGTKPKVYYLL